MGALDNSSTVQVTGTIMVITIIVLFLVVVFVLFLHLYAKWFWWRIEQPPLPPRRRRQGQQDLVSRGLDLSVLASIPIVNFERSKGPLECAVCLSEVEQGEKARFLPKCNHGFHVDCIDMWFHSHSTCPLCRTSLASTSTTSSNNHNAGNTTTGHHVPSLDQQFLSSSGHPTGAPEQTQLTSGGTCLEQGSPSTQHLLPQAPAASGSSSNSCTGGTRSPEDAIFVVDVPAQISYTAAADEEEEEEAKSPTPTRLRSLKRMLSRERSMAASSTSCNDCPSDQLQV